MIRRGEKEGQGIVVECKRGMGAEALCLSLLLQQLSQRTDLGTMQRFRKVLLQADVTVTGIGHRDQGKQPNALDGCESMGRGPRSSIAHQIGDAGAEGRSSLTRHSPDENRLLVRIERPGRGWPPNGAAAPTML
jgi:hypothetical protein